MSSRGEIKMSLKLMICSGEFSIQALRPSHGGEDPRSRDADA